MIISLFIRNIYIILYNIYKIFNLIKKKNLKKIIPFILFYIFINLYLFPTYALCEIDLDLLDREHNMYKGSRIVYETEDEIVTKQDMRDVNAFLKFCVITGVVAFGFYLTYLTHMDD